MSSDSSSSSGMRALILVGGFGTRLRPLTLTTPKPLIPFCNKPMIVHQIEALKEVGVTEIVLAVAYRPEVMMAEMEAWGEKIGVKILFSIEEEPLGTAGPIGLAREILLRDDKPFFVLNSDVTCRFPLSAFLSYHMQHGKEGTILVTKVHDWNKYGVVVYDDETGKIDQFVEKPQEFVGDRINAGIYILNKSVLSRIPAKRTSIEKEIFPVMAGEGQLHAFNLEGFWKDIGQPQDFIHGISLFLPSLLSAPQKRGPGFITSDSQEAKALPYKVIGCVIIDPSAKIGAGSVIGPNVSVGPNCTIGKCCRIADAAVFEKSTIGDGTYIMKSIVGWNNRIGSWCHMENITVLGDDVDMKDGIFVNGIKVLPNKGVSQNYPEPAIIM